jgi:hypothetical protein
MRFPDCIAGADVYLAGLAFPLGRVLQLQAFLDVAFFIFVCVHGISWDGRITRRPVPVEEDGSTVGQVVYRYGLPRSRDWECEFAAKIKSCRRKSGRRVANKCRF